MRNRGKKNHVKLAGIVSIFARHAALPVLDGWGFGEAFPLSSILYRRLRSQR